MKTIRILLIGLILFSLNGYGQVTSPDSISQEDFNRFMQNANSNFEQFKRQINEEFDRFLAETWTEFECFKGESGFFSTPKPTVLSTKKTHAGTQGGLEGTPSYEVTVIPAHDDDAGDDVPEGVQGLLSIRFYGKTLRFHLPESLKVKSKSLREADVAAYYKVMSSRPEVMLLHQELVSSVKRMGLNPWGYYMLLRTLSEKAFANVNDRVLFCFYMLHHNGFMARVGRGRQSGQLLLLLAIDNSKEVYSLPFFRINGVKYYAVYGGNPGEDAYSYNEKADDKSLRQVGLNFNQPLHLGACDRMRKMRLAKAGMDISLPYCTAHLRYYDDMPLTVFPVYAKSGLSPEAQKVIQSTVADLRSRYNDTQIIDLLLNFVQTSFAYKIDEEQFGHEKYFFPEEVIGYPYSDCEDRCALFAWLMRSFLDREVVGVLYNDHLATAVCVDDGTVGEGGSFRWNGKQYVICDPTYPNASMGMVMPGYENKKYEIVRIR